MDTGGGSGIRGWIDLLGTRPSDHRVACGPGFRHRHRRHPPFVRMPRAVKISAFPPLDDSLPRYITATRCVRCSTDRHIVLINSSARPNSCCNSCSRLTICALTETSSCGDRFFADDPVRAAPVARAMQMRLGADRLKIREAGVHRVAWPDAQCHQRNNLRLEFGLEDFAMPTLRMGFV